MTRLPRRRMECMHNCGAVVPIDALNRCKGCGAEICARCATDACPEEIRRRTGYQIARADGGGWRYCHEAWMPDCDDCRCGSAVSVADAERKIEQAGP